MKNVEKNIVPLWLIVQIFFFNAIWNSHAHWHTLIINNFLFLVHSIPTLRTCAYKENRPAIVSDFLIHVFSLSKAIRHACDYLFLSKIIKVIAKKTTTSRCGHVLIGRTNTSDYSLNFSRGNISCKNNYKKQKNWRC